MTTRTGLPRGDYLARTIRHAIAWTVLVASIAACSAGERAPKIPLRTRGTPAQTATASDGGESSSGFSAPAKMALDSGNALFHAKAYQQALAQYRLSAHLAPTEVAPAIGMFMVADATHDSTLAEIAAAEIRRRSGLPALDGPDSLFRLRRGDAPKSGRSE